MAQPDFEPMASVASKYHFPFHLIPMAGIWPFFSGISLYACCIFLPWITGWLLKWFRGSISWEIKFVLYYIWFKPLQITFIVLNRWKESPRMHYAEAWQESINNDIHCNGFYIRTWVHVGNCYQEITEANCNVLSFLLQLLLPWCGGS